ncbi:Flp pilus assembly protein CpaB [Sphingomonas daechungensis]|uniref:Flp pilus assembly protein CpaB n=1 Tax=Sphingomonas daechungensis TaxID=1176646 RepID=A0ABX6T0J1_9SPHN|nr:Flp pilus assembly protein CpaB [Sphingomonas daechungensis]QNP43074.1 Flp pilus assembly protein CpaB [Sphingomonas daechungensis]
MNRQTLIALGVAVVLGLFAVYLANAYLGRSDEKVAQAVQGTTKVAVAAVPLDYGTEITADKVKFVDYPTASIPAGAFSNFQQLVPGGKKRVVLRPIALNEAILATKLAGEGLGPSIAYLLPDGMRAAAVRINDVSGVAGFVQPMDSVDVLITRTIPGQDNRQVTDVLLQAIKVIAIDQNAQDADGKPVVAKTATLEVNPMDAQKLALAQNVGSLSLVLRKPGEQQDAGRVSTVSLEDLRYSYYGGARPPAATASATLVPRQSVGAPRRVVVVRRRRPSCRAPTMLRWFGDHRQQLRSGGYGS